MNGFELRGIDSPLIRRDLQSIEDVRYAAIDMPALVGADDATGPVD